MKKYLKRNNYRLGRLKVSILAAPKEMISIV
nr:MAG TPA: hypothetical protein [Caudoviricetes sp.]